MKKPQTPATNHSPTIPQPIICDSFMPISSKCQQMQALLGSEVGIGGNVSNVHLGCECYMLRTDADFWGQF